MSRSLASTAIAIRPPEQNSAVDHRAEHFGSAIAEGSAICSGAGGDDRRDERHEQAHQVGEHVSGVREQGERAGEHCSDDLDDEHSGHDGDRDTEPFRLARLAPWSWTVLLCAHCSHSSDPPSYPL